MYKEKFQKFFDKLEDGMDTTRGKILYYTYVVLESIFIPIPSDIPLAGYVYVKQDQWFRIAFYTALASAIGGVIALQIGYLFFDQVEKFLPYLVSMINEKIISETNTFTIAYLNFIAAVSPLLPYKVFAVGSGVTGFSALYFFIVSFAGRLIRYSAIALLVKRFGKEGYKLSAKTNILILLVLILLMLGVFF